MQLGEKTALVGYKQRILRFNIRIKHVLNSVLDSDGKLAFLDNLLGLYE
jgi:hypothetical protein